MAPPRTTACSCQPSSPTTVSPGAKRSSLLSTTTPTAPPVITSPIPTGFAYERASLIRPRMYGSTESHCVRTSTSPGPGSGIGVSTSLEVALLGEPDGASRERELPVHPS